MSFRDTQRLRTLALVLDLGSISAAADVLGYTQSAVSQQLAALEREAGMELVDRAQRPLRATAAGAALRPHVDRVLASLGTVDALLEDLRGGVPRLRLAAFPSALSSFVPAAVRDLRRTHEVAVHVLQLETREAVEHVRAGAADLAVVHLMPGDAAPAGDDLRRVPLLEDHLHVVLPQAHRLARRDEVSIGDLEGEAWILPRRDTPAGRFRAVIERLCAQAGFVPHVAYELDDLPAAQAFVAAGIAIVPMHGLTLGTVPPGAVVRPLAERPSGSRAVEAVLPRAGGSPVAEELVRLLRAAGRARG